MGALGTFDPVTRDRDACHADKVESVVAAVGAADGFAASLELVGMGVLDGVNACFDATTDGFNGVAHDRRLVPQRRSVEGIQAGAHQPLRGIWSRRSRGQFPRGNCGGFSFDGGSPA